MNYATYYAEVRAGELQARHMHEPRLIDTLNLIPDTGARILDVGCGNGMLLDSFRKAGNTCVGIEIHPGYCEEARRNGTDVICGDIEEQWEIDAGSVDIVHMGAVIEHVFNYNHLFSEAHRVLRPAGSLIISTPNMACYKHRLQVLFGRMPAWYTSFKHIRMWTLAHLTSVLRQDGFDVVKRVGTSCRPLPAVLTSLLHPIPTLASVLLIEARKR